LWAVTNGNWLDGPLLPHKPLTKGPFFSAGPFLPDRFFRTVFTRTVFTWTVLTRTVLTGTRHTAYSAIQSCSHCEAKWCSPVEITFLNFANPMFLQEYVYSLSICTSIPKSEVRFWKISKLRNYLVVFERCTTAPHSDRSVLLSSNTRLVLPRTIILVYTTRSY